jgi:Protein of unknown function (DUF3168)
MTLSAIEAVQAAAISALQAHPQLPSLVSGIYDGAPARAQYPYIVVADAPSIFWGSKDVLGREIALVITVWNSPNHTQSLTALMGMIEDAIAGMNRVLAGWKVTTLNFTRSRIIRTPAAPWSGLVEHRVRVLPL